MSSGLSLGTGFPPPKLLIRYSVASKLLSMAFESNRFEKLCLSSILWDAGTNERPFLDRASFLFLFAGSCTFCSSSKPSKLFVKLLALSLEAANNRSETWSRRYSELRSSTKRDIRSRVLLLRQRILNPFSAVYVTGILTP